MSGADGAQKILRNWGYSCELPREYWERSLDPLQELGLLTMEPSSPIPVPASIFVLGLLVRPKR